MSPQTSYVQDFVQALAGMRVNSRRDGFVMSRAAEEITPFGIAVTSVPGSPDKCRPPISNGTVITDSGGTWTATDLSITINGVTVTVTFGTNKATSMAAMATALQALDFVLTAVYSPETITIVGKDNVAINVSSFDVSALTGNMTLTSIVDTATDTVTGISMRDTIEAGAQRVEGNDRAVMTLSGDVITTSDLIDGTINGVSITQITYATSEAVTLQLIANAIKTIAGVADAVIDTTLRTITITMNPGLPLDAAVLTVTDNALGAVAPTFAAVYSAQSLGIGRNTATFVPTEMVPVTRKGEIWMRCEEAMTPASTTFIRIRASASNPQRGSLRTDIDSGTAIVTSLFTITGNSITDPNGVLIVPVELNLP